MTDTLGIYFREPFTGPEIALMVIAVLAVAIALIMGAER